MKKPGLNRRTILKSGAALGAASLLPAPMVMAQAPVKVAGVAYPRATEFACMWRWARQSAARLNMSSEGIAGTYTRAMREFAEQGAQVIVARPSVEREARQVAATTRRHGLLGSTASRRAAISYWHMSMRPPICGIWPVNEQSGCLGWAQSRSQVNMLISGCKGVDAVRPMQPP